MNAPASRDVYRTSRLLDFASARELTAQVGHPPDLWPEVALKELIDNALDAAEEAGTPPAVGVRLDGRVLEVADEGPGIPDDVVADVLDFTVRVSSREAYVGPTRGAQGNALKTILAMPFALDGKTGLVEIEARGTLHRIGFAVDPIAQKPTVRHERLQGGRDLGTAVRIHWPGPVGGDAIAELATAYVLLNPHLRLHLDLGGGDPWDFAPTKPDWNRWRPSDPEPALWYDVERLERRIAAAIHHDRTRGERVRTVRAFVATFQGLTSTARQKELLARLSLQRANLEEAFVTASGELDRGKIAGLLAAMQAYAKPVRPRLLGECGLVHLRRKSAGEAVLHKWIEVDDDPHAPVLCEAALILLDKGQHRDVTVGINNSPALAGGDAYPGLWRVLDYAAVTADDPVWFYMHLAGPRFDFADRGKSRLTLHYDVRDRIDTALLAMLEP
jgi:hypothetical protein